MCPAVKSGFIGTLFSKNLRGIYPFDHLNSFFDKNVSILNLKLCSY